jgi:YD repeat-containing protein
VGTKDRRSRAKWKWILFALLVIASGAIWFWPYRPVKVELLPFSDTPPVWDGSYPYLIVSPVEGSNPLRFTSSIRLVQPTVRHDAPVNNFEVDLHTGRFVMRQTDLFVPDVMPLALNRTYIVWDYHSRAFGVGGNHPYDVAPTGTRRPYTCQDFNLEDGYQVHMPRISKGTSYVDAVFRHSETSSEFYGAQDRWNGNGWTFTLRDGRKMYFPEAYFAKNLAQCAATEIADAQGHRIRLKRDNKRNLKELISPGGHKIEFQYDSADRILEAADDAGRVRRYSYASNGHLEAVSDTSGILYRFEYAPLLRDAGFDPWLLTAVLDRNRNVLVKNKYLGGRISEQRLADGQIFRYEYELNGIEVDRCMVTLPSGETKMFSFSGGKPVLK